MNLRNGRNMIFFCKCTEMLLFLTACAALLFFSSCISFRSDLNGKYHDNTLKAGDTSRISVLFHFTHLEQEIGFDVVPKIVPPRRGFRDIFGESMKQLSNVRTFATFTDNDNDIDNVERRKLRDSLKTFNDVTIHLIFKKKNSLRRLYVEPVI